MLANEKRSSKDNPTGLFYFPVYDKKSIVKTINLEGKMPSAAAMTVLYGKNQPNEDNPKEILLPLICLSSKGEIIWYSNAIFFIHLSERTDIYLLFFLSFF